MYLLSVLIFLPKQILIKTTTTIHFLDVRPLLPLFPRLSTNTYLEHSCTHAQRQFLLFVTVQKIMKIVHFCWHLTASPLPPPPSPPERDRDFYVIFHRMHHRKEQHQTRDVDENLVLINGISYSPVFEKRLLYSYYNMF